MNSSDDVGLRGIPWPMGLLVLGFTVVLASCATRVPQVLRPEILPNGFTSQPSAIWPRPEWWQDFGSAELSDLVRAAQVNNRDLAAASARILEAEAQTLIARSALFPQLTLPGQAVRSKLSGASAGAPGGTTSNSLAGSLPSQTTSNSFSVSAAGTYDLDVWGLSRANLRAAKESAKSARFAQQALALNITASVAQGYFGVIALRERIAIANEEIKAINSILDVIKLRVSTGTSSRLDLVQEQAQLEAAQAQLPVLQQAEIAARITLAVLLGRPPEAFDIEAHNSDGLRAPDVAPGIPSQLLLRRPDVAQAEANLASAHANLDAARAAFLPQFSLTGAAGYASSALSVLLRSPNFFWNAGAGLVGTIFDGGKLLGQKRLAYATQQELVSNYESAVLNAYADVETALGQLGNNAEAVNHLRREVDSAREAFEISNLQYRQGTTDLLRVLQAQETLFTARDQLAQTQLAFMEGSVHLFQALGGGWVELPKDRTQLSPQG